MSMKSIAPPGAKGNTKLLKQYGGRELDNLKDYTKGYATGGAVKGYATGGSPGMDTDGAPAKPSLARTGRKIAKGKKGDAKTNINIIVAGKGDGGDKPPMMPPPPMDAGPMPPPPGAGGPPMRASGGKVVKDGAGSGEGRKEKIKAYGC